MAEHYHADTNPWPTFPITSHSVVRALQSDESPVRTRALDRIVRAYWKPAYKYIRVRWRRTPDDARDLTQGFFLKLMEKDFLSDFDSTKARFRTYFRICLERFVANETRSEQAAKRGGTAEIIEIDFANAEAELQQYAGSLFSNPEDFFDREWIRHIFETSVETLREKYGASSRSTHFAIFAAYDLESGRQSSPLTYEGLARTYGITATDVTNYLAAARRDFRAIVLETIRELTCDDQEFRDEVRSLLGVTIA